ncbi:DUF4278 domain-containing protein [Geminocystis sp. CENA526]|uniref:DUF4278 domain-containing protein n=1 Tax=Geminocystis sp. CENA526 TaxID=1355871 RepID=UPI003D6E4674
MAYRGVSYQYNPLKIQIEGKKSEVKFRGRSYKLIHGVINIPHSNPDVIYRGVSVATGKRIAFLGVTYEHKRFVLSPVGC